MCIKQICGCTNLSGNSKCSDGCINRVGIEKYQERVLQMKGEKTMATKKYHYYVVVFTNAGPKYVTGTGEHHTAYWDETKAPKEFSKDWANDMVVGLLWNGYNANVIMSPIELERQPYRYEVGHFEFIHNEEEQK